ncbi:Crp/Fnr family transcriptional regulator [uncultured Kriegella sp.]|uniref:Crp/Fnr family transcriptional regulator n=1 Tax=uncultured Kriegella sp. TaxID=1798910 RepID=UPI0030DB1C0D|tara:strand:- start:43279 stop:43866 length:588 start_codon:yes stop_codon:yes gene_type:complete
MISEEVLAHFGAVEVHFKKDELIFSEGARADFFYQVLNGRVKMFNRTEEGKEFTQGIFKKGKSFGEPPLFGNFPYPAGAKADKPTTLLRLSKDQLFQLLRAEPLVHLKLTQILCDRLHYKSMRLKEVSMYSTEQRILTLLHYLKKEAGGSDKYEVKLTRLEISELTGLRVETVIRTIKKLENDKKLSIINRKVIV